VVADVAKLAVGREDYYLRELAADYEQSLSGHGESPGRWYGAGANNLGLQRSIVGGLPAHVRGPPDAHDLESVLDRSHIGGCGMSASSAGGAEPSGPCDQTGRADSGAAQHLQLGPR
jgi:hypothetical protein